MTYLLDTCILSTLRKIKTHPLPELENWIETHDSSLFHISVITVGEIQKGISQVNANQQRESLEDWFFGQILPQFEGHIVNIDTHIMLKWGELIGNNRKKGIAIPAMDALIAATAISNDMILVTFNDKDFRSTGAHLFNPSRDGALK
ncbi:MAG: type II toxin-antitoxin system VapC family toxin [Chlamydiia bacterium]|nr:type II toxin-antitoxin system VapC family toxin [Chlamydiia bacterium]